MTSYRLFLARSAVARFGRALAYYWLTLRSALRTLSASYRVTLVRYRVRAAASGTGRALVRLPRKAGSLVGLIAWFLGQLPRYVAGVLEERREDRAELRAERLLLAAARRAQRAERRARRRVEQAEIKAGRAKRPHHLPVPAWISRIERPERPAGTAAVRRLPAPRMVMVAAAITLAAAVPTYAIVTNAGGSEPISATPQVAGSSGAVVPGPAAPGPVTGDTAEFVAPLPPLPTATPAVAAPRLRVSAAAPTGTPAAGEAAAVGSLTKPLSEPQQREGRRQAKSEAKSQAKSQAKSEAKQARARQQPAGTDLGK